MEAHVLELLEGLVLRKSLSPQIAPLDGGWLEGGLCQEGQDWRGPRPDVVDSLSTCPKEGIIIIGVVLGLSCFGCLEGLHLK